MFVLGDWMLTTVWPEAVRTNQSSFLFIILMDKFTKCDNIKIFQVD